MSAFRRAALSAALAAAVAPAPASASESFGGDSMLWHETVAPHFLLEHEAAFAPGGMTLELEKLHNRLRVDLSMFAPWMAKERINLYLYSSQGSYLRGRFKPPTWSNGLAFYQDRTVVSFLMADRAKQLQVLAHETTHLLFEGYWGEVHETPPTWLNEGLAMMEEVGNQEGVHSDWADALDAVDPADLMPLTKLVSLSPTKDMQNDRQEVTLWYVESYGLVRYLYRSRPRMQFFDFCSQLRDGRRLEDALWRVYRVRGLAALERDFRATLKGPSGGRLRAAAPPPASFQAPSRGARALKPVGFDSRGFKGLIPDDGQ